MANREVSVTVNLQARNQAAGPIRDFMRGLGDAAQAGKGLVVQPRVDLSGVESKVQPPRQQPRPLMGAVTRYARDFGAGYREAKEDWKRHEDGLKEGKGGRKPDPNPNAGMIDGRPATEEELNAEHDRQRAERTRLRAQEGQQEPAGDPATPRAVQGLVINAGTVQLNAGAVNGPGAGETPGPETDRPAPESTTGAVPRRPRGGPPTWDDEPDKGGTTLSGLAGGALKANEPGSARRLKGADLGAMFGIELDGEPMAPGRAGKGTRGERVPDPESAPRAVEGLTIRAGVVNVYGGAVEQRGGQGGEPAAEQGAPAPQEDVAQQRIDVSQQGRVGEAKGFHNAASSLRGVKGFEPPEGLRDRGFGRMAGYFAGSIGPYFRELGRALKAGREGQGYEPPKHLGARAAGGLNAAYKAGETGQEMVDRFRELQYAIDRAAGAMGGFAASTSPATWRTFTGSIQLLGGEIVNLMIPAFNVASGVIQGAARWVRGLDEATKSNLRSIIAWGGAFMGAGLAVRTILAPITAVVGVIGGTLKLAFTVATGAINLFGAAIGLAIRAATGAVSALASLASVGVKVGAALGAFAMAHPIIAGIAAITIAVGALTGGFALLGNNIADVSRNADQARERLTRLAMGGAVTQEDFQSLPVEWQRRLRNAQDPEHRAEIARGILSGVQGNIEGIQRTNPGAIQTDMQGAMESRRNERTWGEYLSGAPDSATSRRSALERILQERGLGQDTINRRLEGLDLSGSLTPDRIRQIIAQASGQNALTQLQGQQAVLQGVTENGVPGAGGGQPAPSPGEQQRFVGTLQGIAQTIGQWAQNGFVASSAQVNPQMFGGGAQLYESIFSEAVTRDQMMQAQLEQLVRNAEEQTRAAQDLAGIARGMIGVFDNLNIPGIPGQGGVGGFFGGLFGGT